MDELLRAIGNRIRKVRLERNMTQDDLAEALESGNSRPTITQWNEYCETLGTELDNIIKGTVSIDDGLANAQSDLEMVMMD